MLPITTLTAALFSVSIIFTYFWVRLNWVSVPQALLVGFLFNSFGFFSFSIARGNGLTQAITVGLLQGLIFTSAAVTMGMFFRNTSEQDIAEEKQTMDYSMEP